MVGVMGDRGSTGLDPPYDIGWWMVGVCRGVGCLHILLKE